MFQCYDVFFINRCAKHLHGLATYDSFLEVEFPWSIWRQRYDGIFNKAQWPIEKTRQVIWNAFQNYGRIEWEWTLKDLEEAPDVAYQDIVKKFDSTWGIKNLIMTRSNLVVTWMDKPHMSIILNFHSGCAGSPGLVVFCVTFAIDFFNLCQQKNTSSV